jgi:hypothetical protein
MENIPAIADEVWNELVEASNIEHPLQIKEYYNEVVKKEDEANPKVFVDFKKPLDMTAEEYVALPAKSNWNMNVKFSVHSINKFSTNHPVRLCHLLIISACRLKIFGDDAFGKVASRCKVGASIVNFLTERNTVFFPSGNVRNRLPIRVHPLNDETYKSAVVDLLKCVNDTNLQWHYVGDGAGSPKVAGLGLPPSSLTDGTLPGSEVLFKRCLHEVKALYDSQLYLKNPNATDVAAARLQAQVLDNIARVANGRQANCDATASTATNSSAGSSITMEDNNNNQNKKDKSSTPVGTED